MVAFPIHRDRGRIPRDRRPRRPSRPAP